MDVNDSGAFDADEEEIIDWQNEANAIIRDVQDHVREIFISEKLDSSNFEIFINVKTLENRRYCLRVSGSGFQVAGFDFDKTDAITDNVEDIYETPYALLTKISEGYVQSFANKLSQTLASSLEA